MRTNVVVLCCFSALCFMRESVAQTTHATAATQPSDALNVKYDKFKDETDILLKDVINLKIKDGGGKFENSLTAGYSLQGDQQTGGVKPEQFYLAVTVASSDWVLRDSSDSLELIILADKQRIKLPKVKYKSLMEASEKIEIAFIVCTPAEYQAVCNAKKVECQLGPLEFALDTEPLSQLRAVSKYAGVTAK